MTTKAKVKAAKSPNKQRAVTAASFARLAKGLREKVSDCKPGQDMGRDLVTMAEWFAEICEEEVKTLRAMR